MSFKSNLSYLCAYFQLIQVFSAIICWRGTKTLNLAVAKPRNYAWISVVEVGEQLDQPISQTCMECCNAFVTNTAAYHMGRYSLRLLLPKSSMKKWAIPGLYFLYFCRFNTQLTVNKCSIYK